MTFPLRITSILAATMVGLCVSSHADLVPVAEIFAHNEKSNYDGKINDMIIGSGMNDYNYPDSPPPATWPDGEGDPSTWTATGSGYQDEWQSQDLLGDGDEGEDVPTNSKIGWVVFDLGASTSGLDMLYLWNQRENNQRYTASFNVYVANDPTVALAHGPTNNSSIDYDFSSGGWIQVNAGGALSGTFRGNQAVSLGGLSGRYVAIEILANNGHSDRVGLAEVAITGTGVPALPFAITEIDYDAETNMVVLTWRSQPGETYTIKYSSELADWGPDIRDSITSEHDENPDDGDHITVSLDLADFDAGVAARGTLLFRVEK